MVEDNENTKKRKGLFGSRRRRVAAAAIAPTDATAPVPGAATDTVAAPTEPFLEGEPAPWASTSTISNAS